MSHKQLEKEIVPVLEKYNNIVINSKDDLVSFTKVLSDLNRYADKLEEERLKVTAPLNEALKAARALFKPLETRLSDTIGAIRQSMSFYQESLDAEAKAQEVKIAARVKEGKGNLTFETAERKLSEIERPEGKVSTDEGSVQFVTKKKFEVMDITLLPIEYYLPNEVLIRKAMLEGKELPGVRYYEVKEVRNTR